MVEADRRPPRGLPDRRRAEARAVGSAARARDDPGEPRHGGGRGSRWDPRGAPGDRCPRAHRGRHRPAAPMGRAPAPRRRPLRCRSPGSRASRSIGLLLTHAGASDRATDVGELRDSAVREAEDLLDTAARCARDGLELPRDRRRDRRRPHASRRACRV